MAENEFVSEGRTELPIAEKKYQKSVDNIRSMSENIAVFQKGISSLHKTIDAKKKEIVACYEKIDQAKETIKQCIQEYNELSNDSDDDYSYGYIASQQRTLQARMRAEEEKIAHLQTEIAALRTQIDDHRKKVDEYSNAANMCRHQIRKIKEAAKSMGSECITKGNRIASIAAEMNNQANKFNQMSRIGFGSDMALSKGVWRSQQAKEVNDLANGLISVGREFHSLSSQNDDDVNDPKMQASQKERDD